MVTKETVLEDDQRILFSKTHIRAGGNATLQSVNYIVPRDHIQSTTFLILFMFVLYMIRVLVC